MRPQSNIGYFDTTINFSVVVTGDKFQHPGGVHQFSPFIENQSLYLARELIKKGWGTSKNCVIEYTRDFTNNITKFTIALDVLTTTKFDSDGKNIADFTSFFEISALQINSEQKVALRDIPYRCETVELKSSQHEGPLPKCSSRAAPEYARNYFGVLNKVSFTFTMSKEEIARQEQLEAEDKVDFIGSSSGQEFPHLTTLKFGVLIDNPPFKPGPRDEDIYELAKIAANHFAGICLNYSVEFNRSGPNTDTVIRALFTFTLLLKDFDRAGLRHSLESYPSRIHGGVPFKIIFHSQNFSLTQEPFQAAKVFYVSPRLLYKENDFNGCNRVIRSFISFESSTEVVQKPEKDLIRRALDGFSRPIKEFFEYHDLKLFTYRGVEFNTAPQNLQNEKHVELMARLNNFRNEYNAPFFQSLEAKQYAQALRRACNSNKDSLVLVKILLEFMDVLSIKINEQAGEGKFSALHYAAKNGNREIYDLLLTHDANEDLLDAASKTPKQYAIENGILLAALSL